MRQLSRTIQTPEIARLVSLIASKRKKLGLSQREFSRRLNLNATTFWLIEQGRRGLQVSELIEAGRVLGESPVALLEEALSGSDSEPSKPG